MSPPSAMPMQTRLANLGEINAKARTIDVVWTTGASVRRRHWDGYAVGEPFDEVLVVSEEAIDFTRLRKGAPVLDSHSTVSTDAIRAVVDRVWLANGKGFATLRFPREGVRKASDELFELAREKIACNISVGYYIQRARVVAPAQRGEVEQYIIERWQPYEISFVPIGADAGAQVRANAVRTQPFEMVGGKGVGVGVAAAEAARARMLLRASQGVTPAEAARARMFYRAKLAGL